MSVEHLQRLATFSKWYNNGSSRSGIACFATKAAAAFFERSEECVDDEVVCRSCGVRYRDWEGESPSAVHRVISPKCPALNKVSESDTHCMTQALDQHHREVRWDAQVDVQSLQENPYSRYLPDHIQKHILGTQTGQSVLSEQPSESVQLSLGAVDRTPEQQTSSSQHAPSEASGRVRRVLFANERRQEERSADDPEPDIQQNHDEASPSSCSVLDQPAITHPFKTFGGYDNLFSSQRLKTFPQSSSPKYQAWAEEGFVFRERQQDLKCVFCRTEVALNGHQPRVAHEKMCPACPFVMGFDVGNISLQQEKDILRKYSCISSKRRAAHLHINLGHTMSLRHPYFQKYEERVASFQTWPKSKDFLPSLMAESGFFYRGYSDEVRCFYCGVSLANWSEEADVWQTHAAVSPSCLHVINHKGDAFISQAASAEVVIEVNHPAEEEGIGSSHLDTTAIQAAFARRYPNKAILKAILKGTDENHATICEQQQLVLQQGTQLQQKDTQLQQQGTVIQQKDTVIQQKDTQLQQQGTVIQQKDTVIQQKDTQLQTVMQEKEQTEQQMAEKDERLAENYERLAEKEEELSAKTQQLQWQDEQIRSLMEEVQRLRADRHNRMNPAPDQEVDAANINNLQANNEELRQRFLCKICMADKPRMIFLPCGHLFSCAECTSRLLPDQRCPVCRQDISEVLPAFVA